MIARRQNLPVVFVLFVVVVDSDIESSPKSKSTPWSRTRHILVQYSIIQQYHIVLGRKNKYLLRTSYTVYSYVLGNQSTVIRKGHALRGMLIRYVTIIRYDMIRTKNII